MQTLKQVVVGSVVGIVVAVVTGVINTGRLPVTVRAVPLWGWLSAGALTAVAVVVMAIRRRRAGAGGIFYHNLWTRREGEPCRIWKPSSAAGRNREEEE